MIDKTVKLDIPCPECNYQTKMSLAELESNPVYICPGCGNRIHMDANELAQGLKDIDNQIDDLFK